MNNRNLPVNKVSLAALAAPEELPVPEQIEAFYDQLITDCGAQSPGSEPVSALGEAALAGCADNVRDLLASGSSSTDKVQALHFAVDKGLLDIVNLLLVHETDLNAPYINDCTVLHTAAYYGYFDIVTTLLDKGAIPDKYDTFGYMALDKAACNGHLDIVKALLDKGVDPAQAQYALLDSAAHGHLATVKELLAKGADPNAADESGVRALHLGAVNGHTDVVKTLLASGARPHLKHWQERPPAAIWRSFRFCWPGVPCRIPRIKMNARRIVQTHGFINQLAGDQE